jgi:hexulose-6-phosphate isomerase
MHEIGVMQGRLVPQIDGKIQAFPWGRWQDEFRLARRHGFQSIEFIFEAHRYRDNPLSTAGGQAEINDLIQETGVPVSAVCADYFMDRPFFRVPTHAQEESIEALRRLLQGASAVGARRVEIPCVDHASIRTETEKAQIIESVSKCLSDAERFRLEIVFETSLPPDAFREFLESFGHPLIRANYDSGNSASLGYDPACELRVLGSLVSNIHIKDRLLHGTTVPLGTGHADFHAVFRTLSEIRYAGPFILQCARDPDDVGVAVRYKDLVESYLKRYFS